ncbi:hypothetical protein [Streptomyces sp. NPDC049040]|uniref:hypothetical protein n=1 Tax=Streptomyces sp. NPDC049040 TaxID=3365593 RepID=UPI00371DF23E
MNEDTPNYAARCLAVWEGEGPPSDITAGQTYKELYGRFVWSGEPHEIHCPSEPPTEPIAAYAAALLERWPIPIGEVDDHPIWDDGLVGNETGPLIYFAVRWNMAEKVSAFAAQVAASMGLVCFDVSRGKLLS